MLYVIKNNYFLTHYILDQLEGRQDLRVIQFARVANYKNLRKKVARYIDVQRGREKNYGRYFDAKFLEQISVIKPEDKVLFFGVENQRDLRMLSSLIAARAKSLWAWNSVFTITRGVVGGESYFDTLAKSGLVGYTFDQHDAQKYGLQLTRQVYVRVAPPESYIPEVDRQDVFFIGNDKKRIDTIEQLASVFDQRAITYRIEIVADAHRKYNEKQAKFLIGSVKPYCYTIDQIKYSRVVLDIVQPKQNGLTLRPLEALFLGKKLITDNPLVLGEPYYDSRYIFVIGHDDLSALSDFVNSEQPPYDSSLLEQYDIRVWINQFL